LQKHPFLIDLFFQFLIYIIYVFLVPQ